MSEPYTLPDWSARLPGEQWVLVDSVQAAEAYLATYNPLEVRITREGYPNPQGLYARIRFPDRIPQHRIYVAPSQDEP